ncbi:hypothetical protein B4121_2201 [Bacillus paralicheniformis]|uniref:Uncharacterized protein n=1 Tax=Bacillus paralicheniformis TaxID=1648923 RepID=A0A7Z1B3Y4_9BACI|nr:hypothetical protein B4121_2201 [Bacillus paralicheniformis]
MHFLQNKESPLENLKTIKSGHLKSSANEEFFSASLLLALVLLSLTA